MNFVFVTRIRIVRTIDANMAASQVRAVAVVDEYDVEEGFQSWCYSIYL